jgi:hypothetical protein
LKKTAVGARSRVLPPFSFCAGGGGGHGL